MRSIMDHPENFSIFTKNSENRVAPMQKSWLGKQRMLTNIVIMKIIYSVESVCLPDSQKAEQRLSSMVPWSIYALHLPKGLQPGAFSSVQFISVTQLCLTPYGLQHIRLPCLSPTPRACSNSCPLLRWCRPTISSSVVPFSSCPQSFPASGSFQISQLFTAGGQKIEALASASILPMNIQGWFPLGLTGLISLQSKGL